MKFLLLSAMVFVFQLACSAGTMPTPDLRTPLFQDDPLGPSINALNIVDAHLKAIVHESGTSCDNFLGEIRPEKYWSYDYLGDGTWSVVLWGGEFEWSDGPVDTWVWKVRELPATSGEVVESPEWMKEQGCG